MNVKAAMAAKRARRFFMGLAALFVALFAGIHVHGALNGPQAAKPETPAPPGAVGMAAIVAQREGRPASDGATAADAPESMANYGQSTVTQSMAMAHAAARIASNAAAQAAGRIVSIAESITPWHVTFAARQHAVASGASTSRAAIFGRPVGGFGNRLYGMFAVLTMALLDDRHFLVDWTKSPLTDAFEMRGLNSTWIFGSNAHLASTEPKVFLEHVDKCFDPAACDVCNWAASAPLYDLPEFNKSGTLEFRTNCPIVKAFVAHPWNRGKLKALGLLRGTLAAPRGTKAESLVRADDPAATPARVAFHVMGQYFRELLALRPELVPQFEVLRRLLKPSPETYAVGFQIRTGGFVNEPRFLAEEDVGLFWECGETLVKGRGATNVRWFVAADKAWIKESAAKKYGEWVVSSAEKLAHIERDAYSASAFHGVAFDHMLLAACDDIVVTGGSTFGAMASMRADLLPYGVRGGSVARGKGEKCELLDLDKPMNGWDIPVPAF